MAWTRLNILNCLYLKGADEDSEKMYQCPDCGRDNEDPERDQDGDVVCEECGTVLEVGAITQDYYVWCESSGN